MKALAYIEHGKFALINKPKPVIMDFWDTIIRVTENVESFFGAYFFCRCGYPIRKDIRSVLNHEIER